MGRMLKAPWGSPAVARISPRSSALTGVVLAGFRMNGQPTASAGAILWAARFKGKLNGVMNAHGPMGTRRVIPSNPAFRAVMSSASCLPPRRVASSAP